MYFGRTQGRAGLQAQTFFFLSHPTPKPKRVLRSFGKVSTIVPTIAQTIVGTRTYPGPYAHGFDVGDAFP